MDDCLIFNLPDFRLTLYWQVGSNTFTNAWSCCLTVKPLIIISSGMPVMSGMAFKTLSCLD